MIRAVCLAISFFATAAMGKVALELKQAIVKLFDPPKTDEPADGGASTAQPADGGASTVPPAEPTQPAEGNVSGAQSAKQADKKVSIALSVKPAQPSQQTPVTRSPPTSPGQMRGPRWARTAHAQRQLTT